MITWSQEALVSSLGLSLLHSLWQGALIGVAGLLLNRRLKQAAPDLRCGAFSLLLFTFFVVWLGTFGFLYEKQAHPMASMTNFLTGTMDSAASIPPPALVKDTTPLRLFHALSPALVVCWALGVCLLSLRHLGGLLLLCRLRKAATAPCLPAWEACATRLAARMGIRRKITLRCSRQIDVPCAFGLLKSTVLLPFSVMMGLAPEQVEALIAHELAHIARHDVFFNLVQVCMETVLFYHPVVWWLSLQIRAAREQSCDDLAIEVIGDRALYARALYSLEEARASIPQLALGAKGDNATMTNTHLIHRIQRALGVSGPDKRDPWAKGALALCAAAIGLAALAPVQAYSRPAPQETTVKVVTKILLKINGDKIELNTTDLKPDTLVKVNGKEGRFGDLTQAQQKELSEAVSAIHTAGDKHGVIVKVKQGTDGKSIKVLKSGKTKISLNINGDKIEFSTTDLKPDTRLKVNGKEGRFGDLTQAQQQQIKAAVAQIHVLVTPDNSSIEDAIKGLDLSDDIKAEVLEEVKDALPNSPPAKP